MTKEMRMTPDGSFVYPWPIIKAQKYLIACPGERAGHYLILLFELGLLDSPPSFESIPHSDGVTPVYQIPEGGPIAAFLPGRAQDPAAANAIERVLSKNIWKFVLTDLPEEPLRQSVKKRFEAQLSCSSCQGLGIEDESVARFVERALKI